MDHTKLKLSCWQDYLLTEVSSKSLVPSEAFFSFYKYPLHQNYNARSSSSKPATIVEVLQTCHSSDYLTLFPLSVLRTPVIHWVHPDKSGQSPHLKIIWLTPYQQLSFLFAMSSNTFPDCRDYNLDIFGNIQPSTISQHLLSLGSLSPHTSLATVLNSI